MDANRSPVATPPADCLESVFGAHLEQLFAHFGWLWTHAPDSRRHRTRGFPDYCAVRERVIFAEIKRQKNYRLSNDQKAWLSLLRAAGIEAYMWRPKDWLSIIDVLQRRHNGSTKAD